MNQVIVRYRVKPDRAAENVELVRAVYDARAHEAGRSPLRDLPARRRRQLRPRGGQRDRLGAKPLTELAAFKAFQREIADRCEERPQVTEAREVGSYRFFDRG